MNSSARRIAEAGQPGMETLNPTWRVGTRAIAAIRRAPNRQMAMALLGLLGAGNLVLLALQARSLIRVFYLNADHASALVLPALAGDAPPGATKNLGNHAWYEPWWLMRATVGIAGHRQIWEAAPFVFGLLGIAAVAAGAWWALGRMAGLLCFVTLAAGSEAFRYVLYVPESHGLVMLHLAVLCGALLVVQQRAFTGRLTVKAMLLIGVPLSIFTAAGMTDQLLLVSGLGPLVLAPLLCGHRLRSPSWIVVCAFAVGVGTASVVLEILLTGAMRADGVTHSPFPIAFVSAEAVVSGLEQTASSLATLGGGDFFGAPVKGVNLLSFLAGALVLLAFAAILKTASRWHRVGDSGHPRAKGKDAAREMFVAYWGLVLGFVLAVFAVTSLSGLPTNERYLIGAWAAGAALVGVLASTPALRVLVPVGVILIAGLNLRSEIASSPPAVGPGPDLHAAAAIERFALANGAHLGYGGYWDSAPVSWATRLQVQVFPIQGCAPPGYLCPFYNNRISSWYTPRPSTRTFLLADTRPGAAAAIAGPLASFGHPIAQTEVGPGFTVYVYGHDIAADLGRITATSPP
jgi:hypothetical protein